MAEWGGWWRLPTAVGVGVLLAIIIDRLTEYFTGTHAAPVNDIKRAADTGPATLILNGVSVGFEFSVWSVLVIAMTIVASIFIFGSIPGFGCSRAAHFHPVRRCHDRHRYADPDRQQRGHGLLRPHRG